MHKNIDLLEKQINLIKTLEEYTIEIYVKNGNFHYSAKFLNTDGSQSSIQIPIEDIVYLTEYGTINIPAKHIIENIIIWCNTRIDFWLNKILDGIFEQGWDNIVIQNQMLSFEFEINSYIQTYLSSNFKESKILSKLLGIDESKSEIVDVEILKKHICCKITKKSDSLLYTDTSS